MPPKTALLSIVIIKNNLHLWIRNQKGKPTMKKGESYDLNLSEQNKGYIIDLSKRDLELWLDSFHPVLLVLFDAQNEQAYYTDLQTYFQKNRILLKNVRKFVRVYFSPEAIFDKLAIHNLQNIYK
jgi:hypothetical protein